MPTFAVTLRDKQSGKTLNTKTVADSMADLTIDRTRYDVVDVTPDNAGTIAHLPRGAIAIPHTAAANGASTSDAAIINLLASLDQRQDRWFRRRTGVVSIMLGTFLGLSLFALTVAIIALALGRPL